MEMIYIWASWPGCYVHSVMAVVLVLDNDY